jgi:hypothetical protein
MFEFWAVSGLVYLLYLTFFDLKNNMRVDARPNYVMVGMTFALVGGSGYSWWLTLLIVAGGFLFWRVASVLLYRLVGRADVVSISWVWFGLALIDLWAPLYFVLFLFLSAVVTSFLRKRILRVPKAPFFPAILASYVFACVLLFLQGVLF